MENTFKESRFIEQIIVIGEGEKHPAAFIQPEWIFIKDWCKRKGINYSSDAQIVENEQLIARIQKEVDHYNQRFGKWEQIKKFALTPDTWSIDKGHVTPTLKLKRKNIMKMYAAQYENMFGHPPR